MTSIIGIGDPEFAFKSIEKNGFEVTYIIARKKYNAKNKYIVGRNLIVVDEYNYNELYWLIEAISKKRNIKGIVCFDEEAQYATEEVCLKLGYMPIGINSITVAKDKFSTREMSIKCGFKSVKYDKVNSIEDIKNFLIKNGYPAILKARDGMGSSDILFIKDPHTLPCSINLSNKYIIEEYIEGLEYSVECITINKKHYLIMITDKGTTGEPYFVEYQHIVNGKGMGKKNVIIKYVFNLLNAIGIENGITHTEIKINNDDIYLIETHVRPGGDCIMDLIEAITGVNPFLLLTYHLVNDTVNRDCLLQKITEPSKYVAGIRYFRHKQGIIQRINGIEMLEKSKFFYRKYTPYTVGESTHSFMNSFDRDGWIMLRGDSYKKVLEELDYCESRIHIEVMRGE